MTTVEGPANKQQKSKAIPIKKVYFPTLKNVKHRMKSPVRKVQGRGFTDDSIYFYLFIGTDE